MFRTVIATLLISLLPITAFAGEVLTYTDGKTTFEGYLARTETKNAPIVLIAHQWKGLTDNERMRADMLAAQGYNAFALDLYGQGIRPGTNEDAAAEATKYKSDPALARERLHTALNFVRTLEGMDKTRVSIIGYCLGGTMALELARTGADIKSAVSFHGGLGTKAPVTEPGAIKASILVLHGADDPFVPAPEVQGFIAEMKTARSDWAMTQYAGAVHAFTQKEAGNDPSTGAAYQEKADRRSWAETLDFLAETLKTP